MRRRRRPLGLRVFKVAFWTVATVLPVGLLFVVPAQHLDLIFNTLTVIAYVGVATAFYQLILRIAYLTSGEEALEQEIRDSEGRVELNLRDRSRGGRDGEG